MFWQNLLGTPNACLIQPFDSDHGCFLFILQKCRYWFLVSGLVMISSDLGFEYMSAVLDGCLFAQTLTENPIHYATNPKPLSQWLRVSGKH